MGSYCSFWTPFYIYIPTPQTHTLLLYIIIHSYLVEEHIPASVKSQRHCICTIHPDTHMPSCTQGPFYITAKRSIAESLWCSLMPILMQLMQGSTSYAPAVNNVSQVLSWCQTQQVTKIDPPSTHPLRVTTATSPHQLPSTLFFLHFLFSFHTVTKTNRVCQRQTLFFRLLSVDLVVSAAVKEWFHSTIPDPPCDS